MLDRSKLTKLISAIENGGAVPKLPAGQAQVIGITGPPGVGKSTLIDRLIEHWRNAGKTVAVIAVDPSSPITGGALLGDRLRMQRHTGDEGVFIRSVASRKTAGGIAGSTPQMVHALSAAGFDIVVVETVGAGQNDVAVAEVADVVAAVLTPELGDDIQRAKAGLMEIADIVVINKCDLGRAARGMPVSALTGAGTVELAKKLLQAPGRGAK